MKSGRSSLSVLARTGGCVALLWMGAAGPLLSAAAAGADTVLEPGPEQIPEWARQGRFRFTRLDGGPIEVRKTMRSAWGMHFNDHEKEVLANLYTKYSDRMVDLLAEANIDWVWITWSVGFSEADEAEQREQCKRLTAKLHARGIKVAAYMCAVSIFWESMFRDHSRSVRWILFDPNGDPYRYSGGKDPLRFIGDVGNPEWLDFQKRRVGSIIDAGLDSIFFDNTASPGWNESQKLAGFFAAIRRYIHEEKKSNIVLFTNYGLNPQGVTLNRDMEFVFNEGWKEPGVWDGEWMAANIRRMKYVRGVIGEWKPMTSEYSIFHSGNRATTWLEPRSQKLSIAEAAAFRSAYCWDMEGPLDGALMKAEPRAMAAWKAIGEYNGFLKKQEDLYVGATSVSPVAVLLSARPRTGTGGSFTWKEEDSGLYDMLAMKSVPYDIRLLSVLTPEQLGSYRGVVLPAATELAPVEMEMLRRYKAAGGKIYVLGATDERGELGSAASPDAVFNRLRTSEAAQEEVVGKIRQIADGGVWLSVEGAPYVAGTVSGLGNGKKLAIHLLNYGPAAVSNVRVKVDSGSKLKGLAGARPRLVTPDAGTQDLGEVSRRGTGLEFRLGKLDTYAVVVLE